MIRIMRGIRCNAGLNWVRGMCSIQFVLNRRECINTLTMLNTILHT